MDLGKLKSDLAKINIRFGLDCARVLVESDQKAIERILLRQAEPDAGGIAMNERFLRLSRVNLRMEQERAAQEFGTINI